ncbi:hypothetical protein P9112_009621 [Eukaryota sp. TZLM1-RC]
MFSNDLRCFDLIIGLFQLYYDHGIRFVELHTLLLELISGYGFSSNQNVELWVGRSIELKVLLQKVSSKILYSTVVEPINNAPQIVAKPVCYRLKHKTCNTCGISFRKNAKGKTSDRCLKCRIVDNYHPPIRIPQEIHPTKCNEVAFVFQRFLDQLCKGKYAINIIWEFFGSFCPPFEQNFVNISEDLTNIAPRNQSSEKLSKIFEDKCFDNKWSKALSALSPGVKAPNNENTIDKLKILHPYEDPIMDQNF